MLSRIKNVALVAVGFGLGYFYAVDDQSYPAPNPSPDVVISDTEGGAAVRSYLSKYAAAIADNKDFPEFCLNHKPNEIEAEWVNRMNDAVDRSSAMTMDVAYLKHKDSSEELAKFFGEVISECGKVWGE